MESTIIKLKAILPKADERSRSNIENLISRIEWFSKHNVEEKLENCKAEAALFLSKNQ